MSLYGNSRIEYLVELVLIAAMAAALSGCGRSESEQPSDTAADVPVASVVRVTRRDLSHLLEIASEFMPYQEIDVNAKVSGYVLMLNIDWGTHVREGDLMAVLEVPELEAEVARGEAAVLRDEQEVTRDEQELLRAQSAYEVAHLTYMRLFNVQKNRPGLVAQEEVDIAYGKDMETSAGASAAKAGLAASQHQLSADQSALQRDKVMFDYARVTAPFDGVVTELYAYKGALLPAGTSDSKTVLPLCRLSQTNLLRLVIPVPGQVVPDVRLGESVDVKVPELKKNFRGKVARIAGRINMETRTMHTEVEIPNPNYEIVPGMYAYVQLPLKTATRALTVPIQAIMRTVSDWGMLFVVNPNNEIEQRTVPLGVQTASDVQVLSGIEEGELVVFGGAGRFQPGEKVKPKLVTDARLLREAQ